MADGLLASGLNYIDQQKQALAARLGLLVNNPQEFAAQLGSEARQRAGVGLLGEPKTAQEMASGAWINSPYGQQAMQSASGFVGSIKPLKSIVKDAEKAGIKLDLYEKNGVINLSKIEVPKEQRGSGIGTDVMNQIINYADSTGNKITLTPSTDFGGTSVSRLKDFYNKFGFVENKGKNKDFSTRETMYRSPEQSALDIASQNAEKMLGLPKGNTAMDRAKALGFTESGYTGTNRDITAFDPLKAGASGSGSREGALGTWLTNDPRVASGFADWSARGQGGNVVYPLMIRGKNPREFGSYAEIKDLVDANTQFVRPPYRMMQDTINYENAKKALGDYGVLRNTMTDALDVPITQYVVPDPSRLRSRFAAFDPARVNEPDILAAGVPLGLLAGTNVEMPKKEKRK
jgi:predicted GNAT family acetyltransferase